MSTNLKYGEDRSVGELLRDLRAETTNLLQQEAALIRAEVEEKISVTTRNAVYMAVGGLVAYLGLFFLLFALTGWLQTMLFRQGFSAETSAWAGPLIVGAVVGLIGYALVQKAINTFRSSGLKPEKTVRSIRENTEWAKQRVTK